MSLALRVEDVTVRFGGLLALDHLSFRAEPGMILGVIGPNGAGKSTLFDAVCGLTALEEGSVHLGDRDITALAPHDRARLGLGRSFQDGRLFSALTVTECIAIALQRHLPIDAPASVLIGGPLARQRRNRTRARVDEVVELMGLTPYAEAYVRELSTGTRRLVDLACAVAHEPDVLLLDEPSSGVAQAEVDAMAGLISDVRTHTGATILLIEHDIPLVTRVADEILAMETGRVVVQGKPRTVVNDRRVLDSYMGKGA